MPDLVCGDRVSHPTFGEGVVEAVQGDVATVRFAAGKPRTILTSHLEPRPREELPRRAADADSLFDCYIMVDWSANSSPKFGADSVWYCLFEPTEGRLLTLNPHTRQRAFDDLREHLLGLVDRGRRVLVGFDFPYGFPRGTGEMLGFTGGPAWRVMWEELGQLVDDGADNHNNRFDVAAEVNGAMTGGPAPFWGCPTSGAGPFLQTKRPRPWPDDINESRMVDRVVHGAKSVWQLYGAGSVGSQTLLGLPRLAALRDDPALEAVSHVWPFESGGTLPPIPQSGSPFVLYAEVYPSLVPPSPLEDVKDAAQVRALAEHFAGLDDEGALGALLDLSALDADDLAMVTDEEGWILGAQVPGE